MKYLCFIRHSETYRESAPPAALMDAMIPFMAREMKTGTLVDTGGLLPSKDGVRIRLAGDKLTTTDGPFAESKEIIGGWAIMQGERAEVLRVSREFVDLHRQHWPGFECECEIRPMFERGQGPR